jgi:hypothetical protein
MHREFFMGFDQFALVIVNLLPKAHRGFVGIYLLQITRLPAQTPGHVQPITPSATGQLFPLTKFPFRFGGVCSFHSAAQDLRLSEAPGGDQDVVALQDGRMLCGLHWGASLMSLTTPDVKVIPEPPGI